MWIWSGNNKRVGSWGMFPSSQYFEDRRVCWSSEMGIRNIDKHQLLTRICTNQTTSWLLHNLNIFGARTSHGQIRTHKTHHSLDLGETTTLPPYSILYASPRGPHPNGILSRDSQVGILKFPNLGLLWLCGPITLCANLRLKWGLKQSYSPCRELFNNM
jgi:hypothetical protein